MDAKAKAQLADQLKLDVIGLVQEMDRIHKQLADLNSRFDRMEQQAGDIGLEQVKAAFRDAYVKVSESGRMLVEAHMILGNLAMPLQQKKEMEEHAAEHPNEEAGQ